MNWSDLSMSQRSELMQIYLKNGITSLDEMKKHYNSFAEGGNTDIPPERFFGIATPEVTDNNIYYSRNSLLPEVNITAKGDPRRVNNDYYKAHAAERTALQDGVARRADQGWVPRTMLGLAALPFAVEGAVTATPYIPQFLNFTVHPTSSIAAANGLRGVAPVLKAGESSAWALSGGLGLKDAIQKGINKEIPWYDALGEGVVSGLMATEGIPALRGSIGLIRDTKPVLKNARIASELNKTIKSTRLQPKIVENPVHNRFKLGDVEINNPNLFYRQGDGPLAEDLIESGIVRTKDTGKRQIMGTLNLTKPTQSNAMFNKGRVAFNPESDMGKNLITTSAYDKMNATQPKTWTGDAVYVNNWHSNPITKQEATAYIFEPGYGYRRYSNNSSTLPLKDILDTKISLTHVYPREYLEPLVSSKHKSLIIPSTADNPIGWRDDPVLFLDNSILKKYPHQSYLGDGETNTVNGVWGRKSKNLTNYSIEELQNDIDDNIELVKTPYLPEKSHPATDDEVLFNSRLRRYTELNNPEMYKGADTYDEVHFHSPIPVNHVKYAFVPNEADLPYFDELGIKTNFDFSGDEGYDLQKFKEWILNNDNEVAFKDGGRIHIKPENRGKFTALKKRTGHSASWFKENGTPAQKKMAVFELNSRKWRK